VRKGTVYAGGAIRGARKAGGIAELCREVELEKFNLTCVNGPWIFNVSN